MKTAETKNLTTDSMLQMLDIYFACFRRDHIAATVLSGLLANPEFSEYRSSHGLAELAQQYADTIINGTHDSINEDLEKMRKEFGL